MPRPTSYLPYALLALLAAGCGRILDESPAEADASTEDASQPSLVPPTPAADASRAEADASERPDARLVDAAPLGPNTGAPCTEASSCRSTGQGNAPKASACHTGWPGGYCRSFCSTPRAPASGVPLSRSDCPVGSLCLATNELPEAGVCLRECSTDGDCRVSEGYYCRRTFDGAETPSGVCAPSHCRTRGCGSADCDC